MRALLRLGRAAVGLLAAGRLGRAAGLAPPSNDSPELRAAVAADRLFLVLAAAGAGVSDVRVGVRAGAPAVEVRLVDGADRAAVPERAGAFPVVVRGGRPGRAAPVIASPG